MSKMLKVVGASWMRTKVSSYILASLGVLAILTLVVGQIHRTHADGTYTATVFYSKKTGYHIEFWGQSNDLAEIPRGVARAYFRMNIDTTGWSQLEIETDGSYDDEIQAYAAGIAEGALTWSLIHNHISNTISSKCEDTPIEKQCNKLRDALETSAENWMKQAKERAGDDPFWHQVWLHYMQISGIYSGWKHGVARKELDYETKKSDLYWLNSVAEIPELQHKLNISLGDEALSTLPDLSTAFVRIVNTTVDGTVKKLYVAQNGAGTYSSMMRILKRYQLNYHRTVKDSQRVTGTSVSFSSYPGSITSQDEFYVVRGNGHKMAVTGTALRNYNDKLWENVNITDELPIGPRLTVANRLATDINSWSHMVASKNSGTASKQWLVIDYSRFDALHHQTNSGNVPHGPIEVVTKVTVKEGFKHTVIYRGTNSQNKGLLGLVEQVPGHTHISDVSDIFLAHGYWATYGLPYFEDIAKVTHIDQMEALHGNVFSETKSPRALLFKNGYRNVTSLDSIIKLMRHNNVTIMNRINNKTEECEDDLDCVLREKGYWSVLGVRGDVVKQHKEAYGVIDTKIVHGTFDSPLEFIALSSPPYTKAIDATKLNKGNIASVYTSQFNNEANIDGLEIRDLVQQQQEEAIQETLEELNKDVLQPFNWSNSEFANIPHEGLPDEWAFEPFKLKWSW